MFLLLFVLGSGEVPDPPPVVADPPPVVSSGVVVGSAVPRTDPHVDPSGYYELHQWYDGRVWHQQWVPKGVSRQASPFVPPVATWAVAPVYTPARPAGNTSVRSRDTAGWTATWNTYTPTAGGFGATPNCSSLG